MGPLEGVRVLDLTQVLNGPFATQLLAFLGAEVIKVEQRSGDRYRHAWMPTGADRDGYGFLAVNSNKKGVTLDLKAERGRQLLLRLVSASDVLVENFTPGVMDKLGLAPEVLLQANPRLVYARSSGYGYSGQRTQVRSNASGNMAVTGWQHAAQELAGVPGMKVLGIGDQASGVSMALGICAALYERERSGTGQVVEVSMQEALLGFMTQVFHSHFEGRAVGAAPKRCLDGWFAFHLPDMSDSLWQRLCERMGEPAADHDPRFDTVPHRRSNYEAVDATVTRWVASKSRAELWRITEELGLSAAPVLSLGEVLQDEHLKQRHAFVVVDHPTAGPTTLLAPWVRFSRTEAAITAPAPLVGQHNRDVFIGMLGLEDGEYRQLVAEGVI